MQPCGRLRTTAAADLPIEEADADDVRIDAAASRVLVGYGEGASAGIDPASRRKVLDVPLPADLESFQVDASSHRIYVNLPDTKSIAVIDPAHKAVG